MNAFSIHTFVLFALSLKNRRRGRKQDHDAKVEKLLPKKDKNKSGEEFQEKKIKNKNQNKNKTITRFFSL